MAGKNTAVFGIYRTREDVEVAVDELRDSGFRSTDISVLFPENVGTKDFAHEKHTKAPEGTAAGAGTGALVGGTLGWLAGIGALAIPGVGPLIAACPIVAALTGVGVGGASRRHHRGARRHGHPGIRSQALRGSGERRRHSALGSLGQLRLDKKG